MLLSEREQLVEKAIAYIATYAPALKASPEYAERLRHKLMAMLLAVDSAVRVATKPLLFADLVPGFDLLALQSFEAGASVPEVENAIDVRAAVSLDEATLNMLGLVFQKVFGDKVGDPQERCCVYQTQDDVHLVFFQSNRRQHALAAIGVSMVPA
jgi:hypothetical protein